MGVAGIAVAILVCGCAAAQAEISDGVVRVGVLNDTSGIFQDTNGPGSIEAAKMAAEDFAAKHPGIKVEVLSADHQNKPDVGVSVARRWMDIDKVDAVVDAPIPPSALAINILIEVPHACSLRARPFRSDRQGLFAQHGSMGDSIPGRMAARRRRGRRADATSWFFVTVDYALGHAIVRDATAVIKAEGGKVMGSVSIRSARPISRRSCSRRSPRAPR